MNIEMMREEFEQAYCAHYGRRPEGWSAGLKGYMNAHENGAWWGFRASRQSLVVDLPEEDERGRITRTSAIRAIEAAGVKVKP